MASVPMTILTGAIAQASGNLVGPVTEGGKGIYGSLKCKYDCIQNLDKNFENLENEERYLISRKDDVDDFIAQNHILKEKTHECATWLEDVEKITTQLSSMKLKYEEISRVPLSLSLRSRLKLSKQIVKMTKRVIELKDKMNYEHIMVKQRRPQRLEKFPENISQVPSLEQHVEKLIELLNDDTVKKIGIWGMHGVGKTTILENLNERVAKLRMFDMVLWVTVSREHSLNDIQQTIIKQLTSNVEIINDSGNASVFISESLKDKKYLLLLDGVSSKIELRHVGIHDGHMHGKVILATRERILYYVMGMDDDIKIEKMSRDDARKLFREVVGNVVDHPFIMTIAERIVIQCGEQPHVIRAVGNHLKGKHDEHLWLNTLSKLQSPLMFQLKHMEDLFTAFKLIYEELPTSLQECYLYGASFPEDYEIFTDYLVECWRMEQLIGIDQSLRKACEEGHASLEDLIEKCLFDRCQDVNHVKMPIIFRNSAIRMAQLQNFGLVVRNEEELEEHPSLVTWTNGRVISLIKSNLTELPQRPECPRISSLFLQKNEKLLGIPTSFFDRMSTLKTLDLCDTGIKELPPSISKLTNLIGMYLNGCKQLMNLPGEVGELQNLQLLNICHSGISGFPPVIGELTDLQCVRVSFANILGKQNPLQIEPLILDIFERLTRLEELAIIADPKDPQWSDIALNIAAKLAKLRKLSALTYYFPTVESVEAFVQANTCWQNSMSKMRSNFRSFNFYVGSECNYKSSHMNVIKCSGHRYLQYSGGKGTPGIIKEVLERACSFELINHYDMKEFSNLDIDRMKCLEICVVEGCSAMEVILGNNLGVSSALPWLQELHLLNLPQLSHICRGAVSPNSFALLTKLILYKCTKMSQAISWEMAKELNELQHLRVQECSQVTEVFEVCAQSITAPLCPKLKMLELINLDGLVGIHSGMFEWLGLHKIEVIGCDNLDNLCLDGTNAPKLRQIICKKIWWENLTLSVEIRAHLLPYCCYV